MTLTEIEYGSLASSAVLNSNFQFLQDKITELSALISSETSSFSSSVATLNKSVSTLIEYKEGFIPTGTIIPHQSSNIPNGFLLCDGSEIKIEDYQDLYDVIGITYGQNDSTTFCIPNLIDKTLWGATESKKLGSSIAAGLPNIWGEFGYLKPDSQYFTGAFYNNGAAVCNTAAANGAGVKAGFNASRCSAIYGAANTVQPPAIATNFIIKY